MATVMALVMSGVWGAIAWVVGAPDPMFRVLSVRTAPVHAALMSFPGRPHLLRAWSSWRGRPDFLSNWPDAASQGSPLVRLSGQPLPYADGSGNRIPHPHPEIQSQFQTVKRSSG
jgi:hypothetical protein